MFKKQIKTLLQPGVVAHACNPSTRKAEAGGSVRVRDQPELQKWVQGEPEVHSKTLCEKKTEKKKPHPPQKKHFCSSSDAENENHYESDLPSETLYPL